MSMQDNTPIDTIPKSPGHSTEHSALEHLTDNLERLEISPTQPSASTNDSKSLIVIHDGEILHTVGLVKTDSPMMWQAVEPISLPDFGSVDSVTMLFVQSNEGSEVTLLYIFMSDMLSATFPVDDNNNSGPITSDDDNGVTKIKPIICLDMESENREWLRLKDVMDQIDNKVGQYLTRFKQTQDVDIISKMISYRETQLLAIQSYSILVLPSGSEATSPRCRVSACPYVHHYERLENYVNNYFGFQLQNYYRDDLFEFYLLRHHCTGHSEGINHLIFHLKNSLASTPADQPELAFSYLSRLGSAYTALFEVTGDAEDIKQAISHLETTIQLAPRTDPSLSSWHCSLGLAYSGLHKHSDELKDNERAIQHLTKCLELSTVGTRRYSSSCGYLGNAYSARFTHTGNLTDITQAISFLENALTPLSGIDDAIYLSGGASESMFGIHDVLFRSNLGNVYVQKFQLTGQLKDITVGISHLQAAISQLHNVLPSRSAQHILLAMGHRYLANAYMERYIRTTDPDDAKYALSHFDKALKCLPEGHSLLFEFHASLGMAYQQQFTYSRSATDIQLAISHYQMSIQFIPADHYYFYASYSNLGSAYAAHFQLTGDLESSTNAISSLEKATQSNPAGRRSLWVSFSSIAAIHVMHFDRTGKTEDIDQAIDHYLKALQCSPAVGDAHFSLLLHRDLGNAYSKKYLAFANESDAKHAVHEYLCALNNTEGGTSERLSCALSAGILSRQYDMTQSLNIYTEAIDLLAEAVGLEETVHQHCSNLTRAFHTRLVRNALNTSLAAGKQDLALEWIEQGRCLVWNQYSQLQTQIMDKLRIENSSLAQRFISTANALDLDRSRSRANPSIASAGISFSEEISAHNLTTNHVKHAGEYRVLLDEIRKLPDFHDFLKPRRCPDILSTAPRDGPIVIINVHDTRCDAIAIIHGADSPLHIPLEKVSLTKITTLQHEIFTVTRNQEAEFGDRLQGRRIRSEEPLSKVLRIIWIEIVRPILSALSYLEVPPNPANRPRIWWCPMGPLVFLPLHAAGIHGSDYTSGSRVSDFVVSSYTPSVQSISEKSAATSTSSGMTKLLLVSQPHTPGMTRLPFTKKETQDVESLLKDKSNVTTTLLQGSEATVASVSAALKEHNWAHFACHGVQDSADPLKSGICVHDDRLDLLKIIQQKNPHAEFAFCSSCQSSKGDAELSDEAVHLAAVMLAAGYRGVVGTMWSISDFNAPDFASFFYQYLLDNTESGKLDSTKAAYALDYATRKVQEKFRDNSENSLLTWVPYVHYGY